MPQEILIHITPNYLQVANVADGQVQEIDMEFHQPPLRVGDIYYGKVVRVVPAMRIAFMEIGGERTALLHFTDVPLPHESGFTDAAQYLRVGMLLPVQVSKLPRGEKGAVVTGQVQLIGALVIYQPYNNGIKIAKRVTDIQENQRLYDIMNQTPVHNGVMVRSLAAGQMAENIIGEYQGLESEWNAIQSLIQTQNKPSLLRAEYNLASTFIREHVRADTAKIFVEDETLYESLKNYMQQGLRAWLPRMEKISNKNSPWKKYKLEQIIKTALLPTVMLPSGGTLVIEFTEAMIVIDVNTGQFVKTGNDIIYQTNKEAAQSIAQQIRLRNLGGLIVVDFIRMRDAQQQEEIMKLLRMELALDPIPTNVYGFSPLGLVEISRQRHGNSWLESYSHE